MYKQTLVAQFLAVTMAVTSCIGIEEPAVPTAQIVPDSRLGGFDLLNTLGIQYFVPNQQYILPPNSTAIQLTGYTDICQDGTITISIVPNNHPQLSMEVGAAAAEDIAVVIVPNSQSEMVLNRIIDAAEGQQVHCSINVWDPLTGWGEHVAIEG